MIDKSEIIIWEGMPRTGAFFWNSRILFYLILAFIYLSSIFMMVVSFAFRTYLNETQTILIIYLIIIPFIFLLNDLRRHKTKYVLTNDRLIIKYYWLGNNIKSYKLSEIKQIRIREFDEDYTTLIINKESSFLKKISEIGLEYRFIGQSNRLEYISDYESFLNNFNQDIIVN
ncbi:MAG: hypothetical protein R2776_10265 [Flavobacteriaceae bacterium]